MSQQSAALEDPGFLRALLNLVIPPEGPMPGAGDLDLWPAVSTPIKLNPALLASLTAGLEALRSAALARDPGGLAALPSAQAMEVARASSATHPELLPTIARLTAMAYYQHPSALQALGEPARPPFPEGFELEQISPEWLDRLKRRAQPGPTTTA